MSELKVNSIKGVGASTAAITVNNTDGTCTANITNNLSNRNKIINGSMICSQRGVSFNQAADAGYTLDRFAVFRNGAGIMDIDQSTTVPTGEGFKKSLKCTVDTADSSIGGTDFGGLYHKIEGQDLNEFEFGNSSAKQFTLSFFVRSNITGTYSVAFRNGSANRYLVKEYTISSADTWQKITITDTADLTGTWATDNTTGLQINWCLWEGGFTAAPNTWGTGNVVGSTNNVNWVATVGNTFYLTGVQFEQNSVATDFEYRSFAQELALCQRYYQVLMEGSAAYFGCTAYQYSGTLGITQFQLTTEMRVTPTLVQGSGTNYYKYYINGTSTDFNSFTGLTNSHKRGGAIYLSINNTQGTAGAFSGNDAAAKIHFAAEL